MKKNTLGIVLAGSTAGAINGLFGAGGGLILVPLLSKYANIEDGQVFPCSVSIILPLSIISICANIAQSCAALEEGWPYLIGGVVGGSLSAFLGHYIPVKLLHKILGILIIWGGVRYLC